MVKEVVVAAVVEVEVMVLLPQLQPHPVDMVHQRHQEGEDTAEEEEEEEAAAEAEVTVEVDQVADTLPLLQHQDQALAMAHPAAVADVSNWNLSRREFSWPTLINKDKLKEVTAVAEVVAVEVDIAVEEVAAEVAAEATDVNSSSTCSNQTTHSTSNWKISNFPPENQSVEYQHQR